MRIGDVQVAITDLTRQTKWLLEDIASKVCVDFQAPEGATNIEAMKHEIMAKDMARLLLAQELNKLTSKEVNEWKSTLDINLAELGTEHSGIAGTTTNLWESNQFRFNKRQNKDSTSYPHKDFVTALRLAGVSGETINKAEEASGKTRKGNTYYEVEILDT